MLTLKEIVFSNEEAKSIFINLFGTDLNQVAKDNLIGQLGGIWEVIKPTTSVVSILGCIPLDEFGEIYLRPKFGKCRVKYLTEVSPQLIRAIIHRIDEIFGKDGFEGSFDEYDWLIKNYGITEAEDNLWQDILYQYEGILKESGTLDDLEEPYKQQQIDFLADKEACLKFLFELYVKYNSAQKKYPEINKRTQTKN